MTIIVAVDELSVAISPSLLKFSDIARLNLKKECIYKKVHKMSSNVIHMPALKTYLCSLVFSGLLPLVTLK